MTKAHVCHRCKYVSPPPYNGAMRCTVTDEIAPPERCPKGLYPAVIDEDFKPDAELQRMRQGGCCGTPSVG